LFGDTERACGGGIVAGHFSDGTVVSGLGDVGELDSFGVPTSQIGDIDTLLGGAVDTEVDRLSFSFVTSVSTVALMTASSPAVTSVVLAVSSMVTAKLAGCLTVRLPVTLSVPPASVTVTS
jgi:hypothetical protein